MLKYQLDNLTICQATFTEKITLKYLKDNLKINLSTVLVQQNKILLFQRCEIKKGYIKIMTVDLWYKKQGYCTNVLKTTNVQNET